MQVVVMMGQHLCSAVTVPPGHQPIAYCSSASSAILSMVGASPKRTGNRRLPGVMTGSPSGTSAQRCSHGPNVAVSVTLTHAGLGTFGEKLFQSTQLFFPATAVHVIRFFLPHIGNMRKTGFGHLE